MRPTRREALALVCAATASACTSPGAPPPPPPIESPTPQPPPTATPRPTRVLTLTSVPTPTPRPLPTDTPQPQAVLPGVDVFLRDGLAMLDGKAIGLVTNATGRTRNGQSTIDALFEKRAWQLEALFSPEHGIRGEAEAGQTVDSSTDPRTGLPVYSLYGNTTRPTDAMLHGLDALVYDIQDVGTRTYTYISTLLEVMRAAAAHALPVVVLDRPNPLGGDHVDGNVLDPRFASFVGPAPIAMRYGMTIGELAQLFNTEMALQTELVVVRLEGWQRSMWFDQTGLGWVDPSPNLRSLAAATLYPGMVLFEAASLSEGRGTSTPFEWIGAPWIDADAWATRVGDQPGVRFTPSDSRPDALAAKFPGQLCHGLHVEIVDRQALRPMDLGVSMLVAARQVTPSRFTLTAAAFDALAGTDHVRTAIDAGRAASEIVAAWQSDLDAFNSTRQQYLLY